MCLPFLAGVAALSASACCPPDVSFSEDFEGCSGTCGWAISGSGSASIVSTIHPGEHALRLSGDVIAQRTFDPPRAVSGDFSLISDCRSGLRATLIVLDDPEDGGAPAEVAIPVALSSGPTMPGPVPGPPDVTFIRLGGGAEDILQRRTLRAVALGVNQGECTVDSLRIDVGRACH